MLNRPIGGGDQRHPADACSGEGRAADPGGGADRAAADGRRTDAEVGVIREGDRCYDEYRECVDRVTGSSYALFPL